MADEGLQLTAPVGASGQMSGPSSRHGAIASPRYSFSFRVEVSGLAAIYRNARRERKKTKEGTTQEMESEADN